MEVHHGLIVKIEKNRYFELKTKINDTKHKNHTFTRSKAE